MTTTAHECSDSDRDEVCFVCHDDASDEILLKETCECKSAVVHHSCLNKMLNAGHVQCRACLHAYAHVEIRRRRWSCTNNFLILLLGWVVVIVAYGLFSYSIYHGQGHSLWLAPLLSAISLIHVSVCISLHVIVFRRTTWRNLCVVDSVMARYVPNVAMPAVNQASPLSSSSIIA